MNDFATDVGIVLFAFGIMFAVMALRFILERYNARISALEAKLKSMEKK